MPSEVERAFLVLQPPSDFLSWPSALIDQGYVCIDPNKNLTRVRSMRSAEKEEFFITIKGPGLGQRPEIEPPIVKQQFEEAWALCNGRTLQKTRYYLPQGIFTIELDVFSGRCQGLMIAEIEIPAAARGLTLPIPSWFAEEITNDPLCKNVNLALHGIPAHIQEKIDRSRGRAIEMNA